VATSSGSILGDPTYFLIALDTLEALTLEDNPGNVYTTPDQLGEELVTLTLLPRSKWQTLLNLEVIHVRNQFLVADRILSLLVLETQQAHGTAKGTGEGALLSTNITGCRTSIPYRHRSIQKG